MKLEYLLLTNYRRYENLEVQFPGGVTAILGRNGSGKSTLMEAMAWALYGNKDPIARVGKESIRNASADKGAPVIAELGFHLDGQRYVVRREMRGTTLTSKAYAHCNEQLSAEGTENVNRYIIDLLGLDYQGFYASVFAKQKELNTLSSEDTADRQKLIIRMLGIDAIEKAVSAMGGDLRELRTRIEERRNSIYDDEGHLKRREYEGHLERLVDDRETKMFSLDRQREELVDVKKKAEEALGRYRQMEERRGRYDSISGEIERARLTAANHGRLMERLEREIGTLGKAAKELNGLREQLSGLHGIEKEMDKMKLAREAANRKGGLKEEIERLTRDRATLVEELKRLRIEEDSTELRKELGEIERGYESARDEKDELGSGRAALRQEALILEENLGRYGKRLIEVRKLGRESLCPTCERPLKDAHPLLLSKYEKRSREVEETLAIKKKGIREVESLLLAKQSEMKELRGRMELVKRRIVALEKKATRAAAVRERLRLVNETVSGKEKTVKKLDDSGYDPERFGKLDANLARLKEVQKRTIRLESDLARVPVLEDELAAEKRAREKAERVLADKIGERKRIGYTADEFAALREDVEGKRSIVGEMKVRIGKAETEVAFLGRETERLRGEIARLKELEGELGVLEDKLRYLDRTRELTKDFRRSLIARIRPVLSSIASAYFSQLTDGRYSRIELDDKYDILVYDGSSVYPLSRFSGGEEDLANLCLRLAISSIIASSKKRHGLRFIVLDEVFGSQDLGRRRNILEALGNLLNRFEQVFIITHIDQVRDHIGSVISVEELDSNRSVIRRFVD